MDFKKIVLSQAAQAKLNDFSLWLGSEWKLAVETAVTPEADALNIGGAEFLPENSSIPDDAPWKGIFPAGKGCTVCGYEPVDIVNAALELKDCMDWKTAVPTGIRKAFLAKFDNVFDDYALGFNRTADNFDLETHIRDTARTGIRTFEVNRLFEAIPIQVKTRRAWRDKYQWWCFYSAALDMFVESDLIRGSYPDEMLRDNLKELKKCVRLVRKYGMKPIIQVFEPRVVPETLFDKIPEIRGSRCDLASYSGEAEYALDPNHPLVQKHYEQLAENLLKEVPDLELIDVWTNDSCAAMPWSNRNYMGPNGPIFGRRQSVSTSVNALLGAIRRGAAKVNPACRVNVCLNWYFYGHIKPEDDPLGEAKDILRGLPAEYEANYTTPYLAEEKRPDTELQDWAKKELNRQVTLQMENISNPWKPLGPFQGMPFPRRCAEMLESLTKIGVRSFSNRGGLTTATFVPNFINNEVIREWQYNDGRIDLEKLLADRAAAWTDTPEQAKLLLKVWDACDQIRCHYNNAGTNWTTHFFVSGRTLFRHLVSPQVPNPYTLEYEDTAWYRPIEFHAGETDPSFYDISYYGFEQRVTDESMVRLAAGGLELCKEVDALLEMIAAVKDPGQAVADIAARMRVFKCMIMTDVNGFRNQEAIHRYVKTGDQAVREEIRQYQLEEMENVKNFIDALNAYDGVIIPETSGEDNVYVIRAPITHQLKLKLKVMKKHLDDEPGPVIEGNFVKQATR
ncbi:MAG: hypothetical protein IJV89_05480 [Lentisphaeria bacterium]|nr:hypothetical protein [Lentisphaeria bacterium]